MPAISHLLDTSICIDVLRNHSSPVLLPKASNIAVSSIVAAELWVGISKMGNHRDKTRRLEEFFFIFPIIEFNAKAAQHYGEIRSDLERKGTPIGPMDLLIAAHTRSIDATLITSNLNEFRRVKGLNCISLQKLT